ncbi:hypothetical protein NPIL_569101 [Nephila pilipes]|uniref:Uncharacterized protein n=1 Tax=Nephila pilipes TaxID=299642 RepID=A0A8X6N2P6_NEPPI|nr:hypothetical protein NPIL_569101 [Nephila pilipes]
MIYTIAEGQKMSSPRSELIHIKLFIDVNCTEILCHRSIFLSLLSFGTNIPVNEIVMHDLLSENSPKELSVSDLEEGMWVSVLQKKIKKKA